MGQTFLLLLSFDYCGRNSELLILNDVSCVSLFKALEIDMEAGKINLQDLSNALEHTLVSTGDDNGVYQAALTAYQSEIKHLR